MYSSLFLFSDSLIFFFLTLPFLSPSYCPTFYPSVLLFFSLSVFILNFWLSYPLSFLLFLSYLSLLLSNLLTFWLFYPLSLLPVLTVFLTSSPLLPYLPFFSFGHSKIPIGIFLLDAVVTTKDKHCQSGRRFFIKHFFLSCLDQVSVPILWNFPRDLSHARSLLLFFFLSSLSGKRVPQNKTNRIFFYNLDIVCLFFRLHFFLWWRIRAVGLLFT